MYYEQSVPQEECRMHLPAKSKPHATVTNVQRHNTQNIFDHSTQGCFIAPPPPAFLHESARCVPELTADSASGCLGLGGGNETGIEGISSLEQNNPGLNACHHQHPYVDLSVQRNLFEGTIGSRHGHQVHVHVPEETAPSKFLCVQEDSTAMCNSIGHQITITRDLLYDFEDILRHKVNVHLEEFRLGLQHTLTEGFSEFRSSALAQPPVKYRRCDEDLDSDYHRREEMGDCLQLVCDGSTDHISVERDVVDSAMCSTDSKSSSVTVDQLIDQQLIQLQTYAAFITSTLRRSEYIQSRR